MATLAADKKREYEVGSLYYSDVPVVASDIIYEGAAVTVAAGAANAAPLSTGDVFVGFAMRRADNASGSAGDINCRIAREGVIRDLAVTGATAASAPGTAVYATDDDTFTTTASGGLQIGKIVKGTGAALADVRFEGAGHRSV